MVGVFESSWCAPINSSRVRFIVLLPGALYNLSRMTIDALLQRSVSVISTVRAKGALRRLSQVSGLSSSLLVAFAKLIPRRQFSRASVSPSSWLPSRWLSVSDGQAGSLLATGRHRVMVISLRFNRPWAVWCRGRTDIAVDRSHIGRQHIGRHMD